MTEIVFSQVTDFGKAVQSDFGLIICFDISFRLVTFPTAVLRLNKLIRDMVFATDQQNENGKVMLAYFGIAFFLVMHFMQDVFETLTYGGRDTGGVYDAVFSGTLCVYL